MFLLFAFLVAVLVLPVLFIAVYSVVIVTVRYKYSHLPKPKYKHFFLGHLPLIKQKVAKGGHFSMQIEEWMRECGHVFVFFVLHRSAVYVLEPSAVKEIMLNPIHTKDTTIYHTFHAFFGQRFIGYSLFNEFDHTKWLKRRKLFNPAFKKGYLTGLMPQYNRSVDELITLLKHASDGQTVVEMAEEFNKVALDVITKVAFNMEGMDIFSNTHSQFCEAVRMALHGFAYIVRNPYLCNIDPRKEYREKRKAIRDACKMLRDTGEKSIKGRMEAIKNGEDIPADILTYMLKVTEKGEGGQDFGLEEMVDEFVTFFVAGQETTANLMAFTVELLGRNPEAYRRLQEEVDEVVGEKTFLKYEDINKLHYMSLVFKEVMRLCPPVPAIQRRLGSDLVVNGYKIPKGTIASCNHYVMCRNELFYDDPEEFKPERFKEEDKRRLYAYFPFSLGPRSCIGQQFSLIEAKVIMARILRTFRFDLVPGYPLEALSEVTLKPTHRTKCYIHLRE